MQQEQTGFIEVTGGKLFFRYLKASNPTGHPIILAHGGPGFCHDPFAVLSPLAEQRDVIMYDQLGCGQSDYPDDAQLWTIDRYTQELVAIAGYFELDAYHVLGHSFGGALVIEHALQHPMGLQSIILSSPLVSVTDWLSDTNTRKQELPEDVQRCIDQHETLGTTNSKAYQDAIVAFNRQFLCRLDPKPVIYQQALEKFNHGIYQAMWGPSEFNCTGNLSQYERAEHLSNITVPTLLLCGQHDEMLTTTLQNYLEVLPESSELFVFYGAAHNTFLEVTTDYIDIVERFLRRIEHE